MTSKYPYQETIYNYYLGKSKVIKGQTLKELKYKIYEQNNKWDEEEKKERKKLRVEDKIKRAIKSTERCRNNIEKYENILNNSLKQDSKINFNMYMKKTNYRKFDYVKSEPLLKDVYDELKVPKKKWYEFIFKSVTQKRILAEEEAMKIWQESVNRINKKYNDVLRKYNLDKTVYEENENKINNDIRKWQYDFESNERDAVERYIKEVLNNASYPEEIYKDFELEYNEENKRLIVLYKMPNPKNIPNIIEYKYIKTRDEVEVKKMKTNEFNKLYDNVIYQLTLGTINEIFTSTYNNCIEEVVFNGWVDYVDEATGQNATSCIISIMVSKEDFSNIELSRINYKECIKGLKGVFAGKLISLIPVTPILNMSKEDKRFVENKEVLAGVNSGTNLASMDWEDFEHLVRQLFEHKFAKDEAEVKITQASRDGGVDAVVFDPDPFKGGKFIIQAKRYNNVVPVAATRDLYGTVMHEHAIRGIIVTTSNYGNDSYEFAKDKPLTLINGNELLAMFNELGYENLRINLWENKK